VSVVSCRDLVQRCGFFVLQCVIVLKQFVVHHPLQKVLRCIFARVTARDDVANPLLNHVGLVFRKACSGLTHHYLAVALGVALRIFRLGHSNLRLLLLRGWFLFLRLRLFVLHLLLLDLIYEFDPLRLHHRVINCVLGDLGEPAQDGSLFALITRVLV
jgi:hypothetical protein